MWLWVADLPQQDRGSGLVVDDTLGRGCGPAPKFGLYAEMKPGGRPENKEQASRPSAAPARRHLDRGAWPREGRGLARPKQAHVRAGPSR